MTCFSSSTICFFVLCLSPPPIAHNLKLRGNRKAPCLHHCHCVHIERLVMNNGDVFVMVIASGLLWEFDSSQHLVWNVFHVFWLAGLALSVLSFTVIFVCPCRLLMCIAWFKSPMSVAASFSLGLKCVITLWKLEEIGKKTNPCSGFLDL